MDWFIFKGREREFKLVIILLVWVMDGCVLVVFKFFNGGIDIFGFFEGGVIRVVGWVVLVVLGLGCIKIELGFLWIFSGGIVLL